MRTKADYWRFLTTASLIILCVLVVNVFGNKKKTEQLTFNLEEISVFDIDEQIPTNLKLNSNEETFNVQVQYDTLELYGKVHATRQIVIYQD